MIQPLCQIQPSKSYHLALGAAHGSQSCPACCACLIGPACCMWFLHEAELFSKPNLTCRASQQAQSSMQTHPHSIHPVHGPALHHSFDPRGLIGLTPLVQSNAIFLISQLCVIWLTKSEILPNIRHWLQLILCLGQNCLVSKKIQWCGICPVSEDSKVKYHSSCSDACNNPTECSFADAANAQKHIILSTSEV